MLRDRYNDVMCGFMWAGEKVFSQNVQISKKENLNKEMINLFQMYNII